MLLVSLSDAKSLGLVRYFTGDPCKNSHVAERTVSNRTCIVCQRHRVVGWQARNSEKVGVWAKVAQKRFLESKPERLKEIKKAYKDRNREKVRLSGQEYYEENKAAYAVYKKKRRKEMPWVYAAEQRLRYASKLNATPPWVNLDQIRDIYMRAALLTERSGVQYSVDHIYPLRGRNSCGLHVPWNLQIIPLVENCRKGNRLPEDWWSKSD